MTGKASFEIVKTSLGFTSIRDLDTGEIFHNPVGPWAEAHDLYVTGTGLRQRLQDQALRNHTLILFDVGLGAGFNAMAALEIFRRCQQAGPTRPLGIISFEKNMEIFKFAVDHDGEFSFLQPYGEIRKRFLKNGEIFDDEGFSWELRPGSFIDRIQDENLKPEVIFFDPYSPKNTPEMWALPAFKKLHSLAAQSPAPSVLITYSMATPIRVTMLLAGFFVGVGPHTGLKTETTLATTRLEDLAHPLGTRWLERWARSQTPHPLGTPEKPLEQLKMDLLNHPQFSTCLEKNS